MTLPNNSAFPVVKPEEGEVNDYGLTVRELFAMAAMQGLLAAGTTPNSAHLAAFSVEVADSLIAELAKTTRT